MKPDPGGVLSCVTSGLTLTLNSVFADSPLSLSPCLLQSIMLEGEPKAGRRAGMGGSVGLDGAGSRSAEPLAAATVAADVKALREALRTAEEVGSAKTSAWAVLVEGGGQSWPEYS